MERCGHPDEQYVITIHEDGLTQLCCLDCLTEHLRELPSGWHADIDRE